MKKPIHRFTILLMVVALLITPMTAPAMNMDMSANDVTDASIAGDFLLCRPLGLAATIIGSALFVVSLPVSALGNNVGQVANTLVGEPAAFTFTRPLGKF